MKLRFYLLFSKIIEPWFYVHNCLYERQVIFYFVYELVICYNTYNTRIWNWSFNDKHQRSVIRDLQITFLPTVTNTLVFYLTKKLNKQLVKLICLFFSSIKVSLIAKIHLTALVHQQIIGKTAEASITFNLYLQLF